MSRKSAETYIAQNDFEGAKERLAEANPRWKSHWFNTCEQIYNACKEWSKMYVLDPIAKTVQKIISAQSNLFPRLKKEDISYSDKSIIQTNEDRRQKCYLIEFFDKNDESVCSKVGTTIRTIQERIREELNSKTYKNMGVVRCMIHRVYDCGNIPAEGLESEFRAKYIKKISNSSSKYRKYDITHQFYNYLSKKVEGLDIKIELNKEVMDLLNVTENDIIKEESSDKDGEIYNNNQDLD